ncbi:MAG: hypothetical protein MW690_001634 [Methanophagales archaeon]|nr:hypothetical protein [Methanophagales archaeon]MCU4140158.1 hypothetical protein [Methanophagales archaeon]
MANAFLILEKGKKKVVEIVPANVTVQPQDQFDIEVVVDPYTAILNGVMGMSTLCNIQSSMIRVC